jgi:membrane protein YfhO
VRRDLARGAALYALVIIVAFPTVAAMRRTFAPNGAVAGQMSQPTALAYPERARTPSTIDAGAFSWFFEPMTATAHRALADGAVPLWNPYAGLGMPLVANAQSAVGSPLTAAALAKPDQKVWNGVILFRLLVGAVGCLLLLLLLGATPPAATGAALLYGLAPMFTRWAPQVSLSVEVLAPWLLAAILALVRRPGPLRFAAVVLVAAAAAYGGQPEVLACLAYLGAGWGLYWWWREGRSRRVLLELIGAAVCAALLAAPQVVPTLEYLRISADSHGGTLGDTRLALGDLDALVRRKGLQPELLGWPLAIAAVAGAVLWRRRIPGAGVLLVAAAVWAARSLDTPLADLLAWLPGLDRINVPRYGEFVLGLAAAALAAGALQRLPRPGLTVAGVAAVVLVQFWILHPPRQFAVPVDPFRPLPSLAAVRDRLRPGERMAAIGRNVRPQLPSALGIPDPRAEDALYPERYARLVALRGGGARFGFLDALTTETAGLDLVDATGVRYVAASPGSAAPAGMQPVATRRDDLAVFANPEAYPHAFTPARVAFADSEDAAAQVLGSGGRLRDRSVVERPTAAMRTATGAATATVEEVGWDHERLRVASRGPALLVVASQVFPGWTATVDGRETPIRPANLAMRAVAVPDGVHTVEFRYRPGGFRLGLVLALAGITALVAYAAAGWLRRRRPTA